MASEPPRPRKRAVFAEVVAKKSTSTQVRDVIGIPQRRQISSLRAPSTSSPQRMSIVPQPSTSTTANGSATDASQTIPIVKKKHDASFFQNMSQGMQSRQIGVRQGMRGVVRGVAEPGRYAVAELQFHREVRDPESARSRSPSILQLPLKSARKSMAITQVARKTKTKQSNGQPPVAPIDNDAALAEAIHSLSVKATPDTCSSPHQLPFLRRNLRRVLYQSDGDELSSNPVIKLHKKFILNGRSYEGFYSFGWRCPLCRIKMQFATKFSLDHHLTISHYQCEYRWRRANDKITLEIFLPQSPSMHDRGADDESVSSEEEPPSSSHPCSEESETEMFELPTTFSLTRQTGMSEVVEKKEYLEGPSVARARTVVPSSPIKKQPASPSLSTMTLDEAAVKQHEIIEHFIHGRRATHVERPARPIDPGDPERYPTPPPLRNLEGPSAVFPYISHDTYSARPGGPRLYDILNELSLEEFGLLSWSVIEREEELFELPNIRDEDKVMHALWNRWIILNRNEFLQNYLEGVKNFIGQYWRYIHRAAGLAALRIFLLVLGKHRFLTAGDLGDLLTYYRNLVGFDLWRRTDSRQWCSAAK